ncbi:amino acid ABC transporter membrane protein (PAAT family) [Pseudacidovorax intermedius]|uniref:Amino acid ABC transporter membrane protein (PAAT family) n=1 Tax=Pseudacidovorax intermedius TaxID=433924 RepID=A0A370F5R3_9BURK|nr:amino acid ABC transporter permease [Pseudacidovorax intermedius]RDI19076.1 amino acid ABC transporter membrane protein (PAAT family) [Pseudacidovorax intermedius]
MDFSFDVFLAAIPSLLKGMVVTAQIAALSALVGLVLGTLGGLARVSPRRVLRLPALVYVTLMRATPVLVTLLFLYYGLPSAGLLLDATTVGVLALGITNGAYMSEILRGGIESIDGGQMRAARALGMSYPLAMRRIVLPQAARRVLPPVTNELISLIKNTSLVSTVAISDLLRAGMDFMSWKANTFSPFAGVALGYLLLTLPLIAINAWLEKRYRVT